MRAWLVILVPAFGLWWGGYLFEDGSYREITGWLLVAPLGAALFAAAAIGGVGAYADRERRWSLVGALVALSATWVILNLGASVLTLAWHRESGAEPHLVLPMLYAACASLVLGVLRIVDRSGPRFAAAAGCLGIGLCVPLLLVVMTIAFMIS